MTEEVDPAAAMSADLQLLLNAEAGDPGIRIYRWASECVTLGRFQSAEKALVEPDSLAWAHRPTGGAAVLHGHDVTLSAAVPLALFGMARPGPREVYRIMARLAIDFLAANGRNAFLAEDVKASRPGIQREDCFATTSRCDIVNEHGDKVCGCALRLTRQAVLLQTSIPIQASTVAPGRYIVGAERRNVCPIIVTDYGVEKLPSWRRLTQ